MEALLSELEYFNSHRDELLKHYEGKFALVKDRELIAVFDDPQEAYQEGIKRFGNTPFLIKQVLKEEPTESIPALNLGILLASL